MAPPKTITKPVGSAEAERRLRPALDILYGSADNPRPALKLASQAEAKRPGWPAARAVRAIALRRLGRSAEADALAASILADLHSGAVPADEDAAAKLHLYYREVPRREAESAAAYEAVAKRCEGDFFLMEAAYCWFLRARDWAGAQRVATRLQRTSANRPKAEYAVWTAVAVWLGNRGAGKNPKMDALAAAMVKRAVTSGDAPPPPADVARFATRLLCDVGAHADAAAVMARGGIVMDASEAAHVCADIAFQSGNVRLAKEMYCSMLDSGDADDWGHWLRFIELCGGGGGDWSEAEDFVAKVCGRERETARPARGPFIADMEVRRRRGDWDGLRAAATRYFARFGGKAVCSHDLRPYVLAIEAAEPGSGARLVAELEGEGGGGAEHLHAAWLRLWLGCLDETVEQLRARYETMLVENLESTERQPGDDYILLAAHKLLPCGREDRYADYGRVLEAIDLVEAALARSPFNFHFKLLAIRLYNAVGAAHLAFSAWRSLEVKYVQTATLSHLVMSPMFEHGCHDDFASKLVIDFDRLWTECTRDVPESMTRALGEGTVNAAVEFIEFRDRLVRSVSIVRAMHYNALVQLNLAAGETLGLERALGVLGEEARFLPQELAVGTSSQQDRHLMANEDLQCMEFWDADLYDPERSRKDMDAPGADAGIPMPADEQAILLVQVLATRCIVQMVSRGTHSAKDLDLLRATYAGLGDDVKTAHPHAAYLYTVTLFEEPVTPYLSDEVQALTATAVSGCLAPSSFARAGRLVYQTLLLVSLSLGKASCRGDVCKQYKEAAVAACAGLELLIAPLGGDDAGRLDEWARAWGGDRTNNHVKTALGKSARTLLTTLRSVQRRLKMMA